MRFNGPEGLARVCDAHVVVEPERRGRLLIAELDKHFAPSGAFNMNVRRLVLARRRVHVDAKGAVVEHLDHETS